jgi:hypothetical protein
MKNMTIFTRRHSPRRFFGTFLAALTTLTALIVLSGCPSPMTQPPQGQGNLTLLMNLQSRTLESDLDTNISLYQVSFTNSNGEEVTEESADSVIEVSLPSLGTWNISVDGLNGSGSPIARGQETVTLESAAPQNVAITMLPLDGEGSTVLELQWNEVQVRNPSVEAELIDTSGQSQPLDFSITAEGTAECTTPAAAGYYTLQARLLDDTTVVAGLAEAVQVLQDGTTQQVFSFESVNKPGVMVEVTGDSFIVQWNQPVDEATGEPVSVDGYRLYYREHGVYQWTQLTEVGSGTTEYTITTSDLSTGVYEFAVSALYPDSESDLHTSYDDTADPTYGWYVSWQQ